MGARVAIPVAFALVSSCLRQAPEPFAIDGSSPQEGEVIPPQETIWVQFNDSVDPDTCTEDTVHLVPLYDSGRAGPAAHTGFSPLGEQRWEVLHDGLVDGATYLLTVQTGDGGCTSWAGEPVQPFAVQFDVEAR